MEVEEMLFHRLTQAFIMAGHRNPVEPLLDLLTSLESGSFAVTANGFPMLKVDAETRSVDLEAKGVRESGIKLRKIVTAAAGGSETFGLVRGSESIARRLSNIGWTVTLYDGSSKLATMGNTASALTGHIRANPLKLRRVLDVL
jgi:hypothetical protein